MASIKEDLENLLAGLKRTGNVQASAIVSRDGLLMASDIPQNIHAEAFAAMNATMVGAAETAVSELQKGVLARVVIESRDVKIIACGAGPKALLVVMFGPEAGLGLILVEMNKVSEKVKELL
jgi:hypothetical protein